MAKKLRIEVLPTGLKNRNKTLPKRGRIDSSGRTSRARYIAKK